MCYESQQFKTVLNSQNDKLNFNSVFDTMGCQDNVFLILTGPRSAVGRAPDS